MFLLSNFANSQTGFRKLDVKSDCQLYIHKRQFDDEIHSKPIELTKENGYNIQLSFNFIKGKSQINFTLNEKNKPNLFHIKSTIIIDSVSYKLSFEDEILYPNFNTSVIGFAFNSQLRKKVLSSKNITFVFYDKIKGDLKFKMDESRLLNIKSSLLCYEEYAKSLIDIEEQKETDKIDEIVNQPCIYLTDKIDEIEGVRRFSTKPLIIGYKYEVNDYNSFAFVGYSHGLGSSILFNFRCNSADYCVNSNSYIAFKFEDNTILKLYNIGSIDCGEGTELVVEIDKDEIIKYKNKKVTFVRISYSDGNLDSKFIINPDFLDKLIDCSF